MKQWNRFIGETITVILALTVFSACSYVDSGPRTFAQRREHFAQHTQTLLGEYDMSNVLVDTDEFFSPGVDRDQIAALSHPERWNVGDSTFPSDSGRVVDVTWNDESVAFPLAILAEHEIINDTVGGLPVAVVYCPLCDSVSVIDRRLSDPEAEDGLIETEFGVSGLLYRSNVVIYDRATRSLWSQAAMKAISGPYAGTHAVHLPVSVVSFDQFKSTHPGGQVITTLTGHDVEYDEDFYADYFTSDRLYMPVEFHDRLPAKTLGMGVKTGEYTAFVSAEGAASGPVLLNTPAGRVVIEADDNALQITEAPPGVQTMQTVYFAWAGQHPQTCVFGPVPKQTLLDGQEKSFLIVGYSTSYAWPDMLQDMLDEHAGSTTSKRLYHVLNAVIGGAAVERWIGDPDSDTYQRTMGTMIRDYFGDEPRLRGDAPQSAIALCQQSLQFTRTLRGPVESEGDVEGIEIGADALEKLARQLHDLDIQRVYYGMHIYKKPIEPEVGNERFALSALLDRGYSFIYDGPDVWTPTRDSFPDLFDDDGLHPNEAGMKLMAELWYRTIAGPDAQQTIIDRMNARDYDVVTMMRQYLRRRRGE